MRTLAFVNNKGGVGKTTSAENIAYIFANFYKMRVLFVDTDSQANSTRDILSGSDMEHGVVDILKGDNTQNVIHHTDIPGLDIIPANTALSEFELESLISKEPNDFQRLRSYLDEVKRFGGYDICIIDCPPSYASVSCINAIAAADGIVIPMDASCYSAIGMTKLVAQINSLRGIIPSIRVSGALITMWHNCPVVLDAEQYIRESSPIPIFQTKIRRTPKAIESTWAGQTTQEWSPFCSAARDYRQFAAELIVKEGLNCGI